jgi:hypothetical protein
MRKNSDFVTKTNEIYVELSGNSQRYVNECWESESDGKIDDFGAGCCKRRGGSPLLCGVIDIHRLTLALQTYTVAIIIHWVPGHTNITGNEDADTLAKRAKTSPPTTQLPISLSWL